MKEPSQNTTTLVHYLTRGGTVGERQEAEAAVEGLFEEAVARVEAAFKEAWARAQRSAPVRDEEAVEKRFDEAWRRADRFEERAREFARCQACTPRSLCRECDERRGKILAALLEVRQVEHADARRTVERCAELERGMQAETDRKVREEREAWLKVVAERVLAEREGCARIAESLLFDPEDELPHAAIVPLNQGKRAAELIRARGKPSLAVDRVCVRAGSSYIALSVRPTLPLRFGERSAELARCRACGLAMCSECDERRGKILRVLEDVVEANARICEKVSEEYGGSCQADACAERIRNREDL